MSENWSVAFFEPVKNYIAVYSPNSLAKHLELDYANFAGAHGYDGFISWSPDGKRLAIATECNIHLWTPGKSLTALRDGNTCGLFMQPDWSPDGNFIAYTSQELQRTAPYPYGQVYLSDLFLDSLDGTVHRRLTTDLDEGGSSPAWSPDGRRIAFAAKGGIVVYSLDTKQTINLTQGSNGGNPAWSPDGQFIAYTTSHDGSLDLNIIQSDGSGNRKVAQLGNAQTYLLQWLPDGKYILHNSSLVDLETGKSHLLRLVFETRYMTWFTRSGNVSNLPVPTPHCASGWSRLDMGVYAVVTGDQNDPPEIIYPWASSNAEVMAQLSPGQIVRVWQGPICADGLVFWEVQSESLAGHTETGWMAEGDGSAYYLEPHQPQP